MQQAIIRITAKRNLRHLASYPCIKRVMQEQIREDGTYHTALRDALGAGGKTAVVCEIFFWRAVICLFTVTYEPSLKGD